MIENKQGIVMRNKIILASFCVPVFLFLLGMALMKIHPFGNSQIPVIDMYHQYIPFLGELQYKLQEGGSLLHSWNGGGGINFLSLISYYGASPLNLLLFLFPKKLIVEAVSVILLIKIGLSGSFMAFYLQREYESRSSVIIAFATLYALSSFVLGYYWCIMWLDAVMILPLCIWGLNKLIIDDKWKLYTIALAVIVVSNYYMAIMVCIFILFYYPVLYFKKTDKFEIKKCAKTTSKAILFSILGIALAAIILIPTYISMQNTYYISSPMPEKISFYYDPLDIINQLLPNTHLTYMSGLPNIYCGMLVVILLAFYFINRNISLKEKLLNTIFLIFIFFSLNINKLDFIWHGLHFPNQLPHRYTFVVCFVLISIAYRSYLKLDGIKVSDIWKVMLVGIAYYLLANKLLKEIIDDPNKFLYCGIILLVLYTTIFLLYKKNIISRRWIVSLLILVVIMEMSFATYGAIDKVGVTSREGYKSNASDITKLLETTNSEFARTEVNENDILNSPMKYHYKGISIFSSTLNANTTRLMEKIGVEGSPEKNRFNYNQTNPITNAILNIKYLICKNGELKDDNFSFVREEGGSKLYENKTPLSIGYMVDDSIITWEYDDENPFIVLENYLEAATGDEDRKVFVENNNKKLFSSKYKSNIIDDVSYEIKPIKDVENGRAEIVYTAINSGNQYLFIEASNANNINVKKPKNQGTEAIRNDAGSIINIGEMKKGETFRIIVDYKKIESSIINSYVYTIDQTVWDEVYKDLSRNMLEVIKFDDNYIKGEIDVKEDGTLLTSVPYEKGWTLKVDGENRKIDNLVGDSFISTHLDKGSHDIEISFRPRGLILGIIVTFISIIICVVLSLRARRRKYRDEQCFLK